jgi:DNA mismatch repair protein MutS2
MNQTFEITGFEFIKEQLAQYANTDEAKSRAKELTPMLQESELCKSQRDTTQARRLLEEIGAPPIPRMERLAEYIDRAVRGELLSAEEMEAVGIFLVAVKRMKAYLDKGKEKQIGLAFYSDNLVFPEGLYTEIERSIRDGRVDDYATGTLHDIRRNLQLCKEKINDKA